ncbi:MAG: 50S ribosomal protein L17 [Thermoflexus sp.]|jgi:large subunit ribosomal protein L17|uniref:Large ribosomal subunit protein bL17 n=1 Tax=Thermoflexus hugenholtzii JAD2 TaxID=877466 RepID=A0A212RGX6_9CHLR|nr:MULTISPECIES: 50S ribosomal protein L17 [Thermoflexus]MDT7883553.1 50S ribosomal protein L17 [Thermoflexus sp.]MDT7947083.1 50S ribosomal protein L17 [Thermoflexus sp.]QWK10819.1 MAG: 50S ribosomal protein L17 [Thermoflexus hugenholtzii]SNB71666.1 large subunit ribosomal protein L17 [Thermoflexus hugenholtzii JAD2]
MRHRVAGKTLSRDKDHREALARNLATQLFLHGAIETTEAKAEFVQAYAEKLITLAKKALEDPSRQVAARRLAAARLYGREVVKKLFDEIAPRYRDRNGGYTRIYKLGFRRGDAAPMARLELVQD